MLQPQEVLWYEFLRLCKIHTIDIIKNFQNHTIIGSKDKSLHCKL